MNSTDSTLPTHICLDVDAERLVDCCDIVVALLKAHNGLSEAELAVVASTLAGAIEHGPTHDGRHVAVVNGTHEALTREHAVLLRLSAPIEMDGERHGDGIWFVWLLLGPGATHSQLGMVAEFVHLAGHEPFLQRFLEAKDSQQLRDGYAESLHLDTHFTSRIPEELRPTGRLFGGVISDVKRRLPHYVSDFTDGLSTKVVASVLFLFFACFAAAVAFGGLLSVKTGGEIGVIEMIVATALCGVTYAFFAGQPLTILGSTGPVVIFLGILYTLCQSLAIPFLPTMAWVGLWTMVLTLILAFTDASCWIRYFTRFTDDTFAALIALIFIYEAVADIVSGFNDPSVGDAAALLSLNLALGTFIIAYSLRAFRRSAYMIAQVREFFADFGPAIAIVSMAAVAWLMPDVPLATLQAPDQLGTSTGRPWLVNPLEAPPWVWAASIVPAMLVALLLYLDQNITVRLVNSAEYGLKKGAGYHLDLAVVGVLVGVCSIFGLPWMVAATVRSLNHVRSLATTSGEGDSEAGGHPAANGNDGAGVTVVETRLSALGVHVLIGLSLLLLPALKQIPMSVLFGLFLFMGISAMGNNQFFERIRLWAMDPSRYPPLYYLRAVPKPVVHAFTAVQAVSLAVLWVVKTSAIGILFPLFIGLLVPVRMLMGRYFKDEHLALLDAEEEPHEQTDREGA